MHKRKLVPYESTPTDKCVDPKRCCGTFCTTNSSHTSGLSGDKVAYSQDTTVRRLVVGGIVQTIDDYAATEAIAAEYATCIRAFTSICQKTLWLQGIV
jgi:hypothetical protein